MPLLYIPTQILMSAQTVKIKKSSVDPMECVIILLGVIGATAQMATPITARKGHHAQVSVQFFVISYKRVHFTAFMSSYSLH